MFGSLLILILHPEVSYSFPHRVLALYVHVCVSADKLIVRTNMYCTGRVLLTLFKLNHFCVFGQDFFALKSESNGNPLSSDPY